MSISEVEKMYGKSSGASRAEQYFTTGRFGDIALDYPQGTIQKILIYPSEIVTKDQILRTYGEPTERSNEGNDVFIYNADETNGFGVFILFENNRVVIIQQSKAENEVSKTASSSYIKSEKDAMAQEFYDWAGERVKIGNMAVADKWFSHGAAESGDWHSGLRKYETSNI